MSYEVRVVDPDELDLDEYAALQRTAFAEVFRNAAVSDDFMRREHYAWKYASPAGHGRIAVAAEKGGELVAAVAMFPSAFATGTATTTAWQLCEGATLRRARGRGCFTACLKALAATVPPDQVLFGFPNPNSRPGLVASGFRAMQTVPMFVRPLTAASGPSRATEVGDSFEYLPIAAAPSIVRDAAYLTWRYRGNPSVTYAMLGDSVGYAIVRRASVRGRDAVLLMEFHARSRPAARRLLRRVSRWGIEHRVRLAVLVSNCLTGWRALAHGFVGVPQSCNPRPLVLMAWPGAAMPAGDWHIQLGDWDAF
jgi:hypothetical protein